MSVQDQLDELRGRLDELAAPCAEPVPTIEEQRDQLAALIEGQRQSLAAAEEGQEWVDAVAVGHEGTVHAAKTILENAVAAVAAFNVDDIDEAEQLLAMRSKRETAASRALRRVRGATMDVEITQKDLVLAKKAAAAHRTVTVSAAQDRLSFYEKLAADHAEQAKSKVPLEELWASMSEALAGYEQ